jgi:hypothetical protein
MTEHAPPTRPAKERRYDDASQPAVDEQDPRGHRDLLGHQDRVDDAGRHRRRCGLDVDNLGYLVGTLIFAALFVAAVCFQVRAHSFDSFLKRATIIATTTVGTTLVDFADRLPGIGYAGGCTS